MTKEDLNSDRINYLVWRYLQENNYPETASKLQREWNVEDPQHFDFAAHVKNHALVAVLHRGLLYGEAERSSLQARHGVAAAPNGGFFGPLAPRSPPRGGNVEDYENARKREMDHRQLQVRNGSPAKRAKLSNGHENGFDAASMDVDEATNGHGHAYPSPKEVERPPTPITLTEGPERSTQVDKVAELGSETTYLTLSDPENLDVKPIVLFAAWNPRIPTILAGAGTDRLARLWTISRGTAAESHSHVSGPTTPYQDLATRNCHSRNVDGNSTITSLAWTSDGSAIALASEAEDAPYEQDAAKLAIWGDDGSLIQEYSGFEPPILSLQWNFSNDALLALIPEGRYSLVAVFSPSTPRSVTYSLSDHHGAVQALDATWISDQEFLVCGGDFLCAFLWSEGRITRLRQFETRDDHRLNKVIYDRHSRLVATASDGIIDIWEQSGQRHSLNAHQGQITALSWQPLPKTGELDINSERLLASSGEDGVINIWSTRGDSRPKYSMTMNEPVVALAFTPDGAFLASATIHQILIWKLDDLSFPRARWVLGPQHSRGPNGVWEGTDMDEHCLSWDANGQKLAYGINNNLAVIEWKPYITGPGL